MCLVLGSYVEVRFGERVKLLRELPIGCDRGSKCRFELRWAEPHNQCQVVGMWVKWVYLDEMEGGCD